MSDRRIRIALPSKGRLKQPSIEALQSAGISIRGQDRAYFSETSDPRFMVVFARAFDVPLYIQYGGADLGFTGHDIVAEREADVHELLSLGFGECELVVAASDRSGISSLDGIPVGARVATEYPNLTRKYFERLNKQIEVLTLRGAVELAPTLGLSEIIVDLSTTGETLRINGLRKIATVLESSCVLVCNKVSYRLLENDINDLSARLIREEVDSP